MFYIRVTDRQTGIIYTKKDIGMIVKNRGMRIISEIDIFRVICYKILFTSEVCFRLAPKMTIYISIYIKNTLDKHAILSRTIFFSNCYITQYANTDAISYHMGLPITALFSSCNAILFYSILTFHWLSYRSHTQAAKLDMLVWINVDISIYL